MVGLNGCTDLTDAILIEPDTTRNFCYRCNPFHPSNAVPKVSPTVHAPTSRRANSAVTPPVHDRRSAATAEHAFLPRNLKRHGIAAHPDREPRRVDAGVDQAVLR